MSELSRQMLADYSSAHGILNLKKAYNHLKMLYLI